MDMITRRKFLAALAALPIVGRFVPKTEAFIGNRGLSPEGFAPGGILLTWFDPFRNLYSKAFRPMHVHGKYVFPQGALMRHEYDLIPGIHGTPAQRPILVAVWKAVPSGESVWGLVGYAPVINSDDYRHAFVQPEAVRPNWADVWPTLGPTRLETGDSISVSDIDRLMVRFGGVPDSRAGILGRLKR